MLNFLRRLLAPHYGLNWPVATGPARPTPVAREPDTRQVETEHFRYLASRPRSGKLWAVVAEPVSAAARYWAQSQGYGREHPVESTMPIDHLPAYIDHLDAILKAHWGPALCSHRQWDRPRKRRG